MSGSHDGNTLAKLQGERERERERETGKLDHTPLNRL